MLFVFSVFLNESNQTFDQCAKPRCMLSSRSVSEAQLLLCAIPKLAAEEETFRSIMSTLAWSFKALREGRAPKVDVDGKAVDGPGARGKRFRRGWLWCITGDLEWYAQEFGFPFAASNFLCPYCKADQKKKGTENPFTDFRPTASWRHTVRSKQDMEKLYGSHPLFKGVPGLSVCSIKLDTLHTLDLGASAYCFGSVLWSILNQLPGTNRASACLKCFFDKHPWGWAAQCHTWAGKPHVTLGVDSLDLREKQTC